MDKFIGIVLGIIAALIIVNAICATLAAIIWAFWHFVAEPVFHAPEMAFHQVFIASVCLTLVLAFFRKSK